MKYVSSLILVICVLFVAAEQCQAEEFCTFNMSVTGASYRPDGNVALAISDARSDAYSKMNQAIGFFPGFSYAYITSEYSNYVVVLSDGSVGVSYNLSFVVVYTCPKFIEPEFEMGDIRPPFDMWGPE